MGILKFNVCVDYDQKVCTPSSSDFSLSLALSLSNKLVTSVSDS